MDTTQNKEQDIDATREACRAIEAGRPTQFRKLLADDEVEPSEYAPIVWTCIDQDCRWGARQLYRYIDEPVPNTDFIRKAIDENARAFVQGLIEAPIRAKQVVKLLCRAEEVEWARDLLGEELMFDQNISNLYPVACDVLQTEDETVIRRFFDQVGQPDELLCELTNPDHYHPTRTGDYEQIGQAVRGSAAAGELDDETKETIARNIVGIGSRIIERADVEYKTDGAVSLLQRLDDRYNLLPEDLTGLYTALLDEYLVDDVTEAMVRGDEPPAAGSIAMQTTITDDLRPFFDFFVQHQTPPRAFYEMLDDAGQDTIEEYLNRRQRSFLQS